MKKLVLAVLISIDLMAMGQDTVESLTICENSNQKLLITVIRAEDNKNDRAIFVNDFTALQNNELEYFIPIQNPKSLRTATQIQKWVNTQFGTSICSKISEDAVQTELDRQTGTQRF